MNLYNWIAFGLLLFGGLYDLRRRRIPNALNFSFFLLGFVHQWSLGTPLSWVEGLLFGMALLIVPYLMGGFGAGDVKLLGVVCGFVGWPDAVSVGLLSLVAGGVLVLVLSMNASDIHDIVNGLLSSGGTDVKTFVETCRRKRETKVPYALAMTTGFALFLLV